MKSWVNFLKVFILIAGIIVLSFNVLLYNFCEKEKAELNATKDKQDVESEFNSNKFKYQEDQIERMVNDLGGIQQEIKDQKYALLQEVEKRQQVENDSKSAQTSLVDIKAEADAIKQDMKGWQKDYVSVLAQLEKKMDDSQGATKSVKENLDALNIPELKENINSLKADVEKLNHPADNDGAAASAAPDKKIERGEYQSQ